MCFLCGETCIGCKDFRKVLSGTTFDEKIRQLIKERCFDEWAVAVQGRMQSVNDLFAADAVYHLTCYVRFSTKLPHTPMKRKRGRPKNDDAQLAFEMLCTKLEQECENEMYTLNELHSIMCQLKHTAAAAADYDDDDDLDVYGKDYLKLFLQDRDTVYWCRCIKAKGM